MGILNAVSQATRLVAYNTLRMSQELLLVSSCMRSQWDALFSYRTVLEIVWHHFFSFFIGERWLFFFPPALSVYAVSYKNRQSDCTDIICMLENEYCRLLTCIQSTLFITGFMTDVSLTIASYEMLFQIKMRFFCEHVQMEALSPASFNIKGPDRDREEREERGREEEGTGGSC